MAKNNIIPPSMPLTDIRNHFGSEKSRDFYKGTSFNMGGKWLKDTHYYNDEFSVSFVSYSGALLYCLKGHISNSANEPQLIFDSENKSIIGIQPSDYWEYVMSSTVNVIEPTVQEVNFTYDVTGSNTMFPMPSWVSDHVEVALYYNGQRQFQPNNYTYDTATKVITTTFTPVRGCELIAVVGDFDSSAPDGSVSTIGVADVFVDNVSVVNNKFAYVDLTPLRALINNEVARSVKAEQDLKNYIDNKDWYGTQTEYDAIAIKDTNVTYYIYA